MDIHVIELLVGAVLPPFIDIINNHIGSTTLRYIISLIVCLVIGGVTSALQGNFSSDFFESGTVVFAAAQTVYKTYWGNSAMRLSIFQTRAS